MNQMCVCVIEYVSDTDIVLQVKLIGVLLTCAWDYLNDGYVHIFILSYSRRKV